MFLVSAMASSPATSLIRSRSAPQAISALTPTTSTSEGLSIQRSASHVDVEKDSYTKRRVATRTTKSRQGIRSPAVPTSPGEGGPFNLSGFFPTSLSAIESEEEEWRWLRREGDEGKQDGRRYRGEEEGPVRGGRSAIFGEETSDTIKGEDKMGVLALKDVSLFGASTAESDAGHGRLMSPYAVDEVVDEHSLYLAQRARREDGDGPAAAGSAGYGEVFLA